MQALRKYTIALLYWFPYILGELQATCLLVDRRHSKPITPPPLPVLRTNR